MVAFGAQVFSPDSRILAVAGSVEVHDVAMGDRVAGEARLWNVASGRLIGPPLVHPDPVWSAAFHPNGRVLLTGCQDGCARFFAVSTCAPIGKPERHEGTVTSVTFGPDGTAITASAGGERHAAARIWEPLDTPAFGDLLLQEGDVFSMAFSPDGRELLTGANDRVARVWELNTRHLTELALKHAGTVVATEFFPDGQTFMTGCENRVPYANDGFVQVWDRKTGRTKDQPIGMSWVRSATISPDGRTVVIGDHSGHVQLWDQTTHKKIDSLFQDGVVLSVAISPDGRSVAAGSAIGVSVWDLKSRRLIWRWAAWNPGPFRSGHCWVTFSTDGNRLLAMLDGDPKSWNLVTGQSESPPLFHPETSPWKGAILSDGRSIAIAEWGGVTRLWDMQTGKTIGPPLLRNGSRCVSVLPNGQTIAAGGTFGRIALWQVPQPMDGSLEHVRTRVEAATDLMIEPEGVVRALRPEERIDRLHKLKSLPSSP